MKKFKTIKENASAEIVGRKSRFISNVVYVESVQEAEAFINKIKKDHYNAKHNCFAYIIIGENGEKIKKFSDDGEPSGAAGAPMLEILEKQNLCNLLVVVTRYFGGILLGTGGLVRAYSGATIEALNSATIVNKTIGYEVEIQIDYKDLEPLKYYLEKENFKITHISFTENVELLVEIPINMLDVFQKNNKEKIKKQQIRTKKYIEI